jgi:PAS domain S-box-containing protein
MLVRDKLAVAAKSFELSDWRYWFALGAIASVYFGAAKFGLSLAFVDKQVSAVWPPAGIALAMLLLFGLRMWPGIMLGAFVINSATGTVTTAAAVALGNTLEAVVGALMLRKLGGFNSSLQRLQDVFGLIGLAALLSTAIGATVGATALCVAGKPWSSFGELWFIWWLGDAMGDIIVAPCLLCWAARPRIEWRGWQLGELAALFVGLTSAAISVLTAHLMPGSSYTSEYLLFPFIIWAALRFGQRETVTSVVLISAIAIWGAIHETGPFSVGTLNERLNMLVIFLGVIAVTALTLGTITTKRKLVDADLRRSRDELKLRVQERTQELAGKHVALQREVAERKNTEADLRRANVMLGRSAEEIARLAAIVEASDDAIMEVSLDGVIMTWNSGAEAMFGYSAEEVIGWPISTLMPQDRSAEMKNILEKVGGGERLKYFETIRVKKDGTPIPVSLTVSPIKDDTGRIVSTARTTRDISIRKRFERSLQDTNRLKSEFLANMSHELRTPLNAVIGFSELLVDEKLGQLNPEQKEYVGDILTSGRHLLQLINDVLDLSKIEAGKMELYPENFPIEKAIEEVCAIARATARKKRIEIHTEVAAGLGSVTLDQQKFKQVLYNLVSNGIKFTGDGGRVDIAASRCDPDHFKLSVKDSGIGIKTQDLKRLFFEFEQLESGASRRYEGTGLGLALMQKIVERQHGVVDVQSEFGKGSTFSVVLPLVIRRGNL